MKGRLLITLVVLAMAATACAEPGLVGGDDETAQESESVTEETTSDDTSTSEGGAGEELAAEPESTSVDSPSSEKATDEEPVTDSSDADAPRGEASDSVDPDLTPAEEQPVPADSPELLPEPVAGLQPIIDLAKADLAKRLSLEAEAISVARAEFVVWPDGGLGCPQPGMAYVQVLVDGTYIELIAGGVMYPYHSGGDRGPFLCEAKG